VVELLNNKKRKIDHRTLSRCTRRTFRHQEALSCIQRDYLGVPGDVTTPLFGVEFEWMFRMTRGRFQVLMEDVMACDNKFYKSSPDDGVTRSSLEARLLLPIKTLAYGVPPHAFIDYFQMSSPYARECCKQFDKVIKSLYQQEFLRLPTVEDFKAITKLHKDIHHVDGLIGSLDCTHTYWKNCPKAWQQSFKGKEKQPSIVLEAVSDYHLFFWHASYGYPGAFNDLNILSMSPLLQKMLDGSLADAENIRKQQYAILGSPCYLFGLIVTSTTA